MASFNKVLLMGNLTRDPELRYTPNGSAVCEFGMAINRTYTSNNEKKEEVCYVDINVWGKQAETCNRYLQKGSPVFVEGRLQLDQWNDKETGKPRSRMRVVGERIQFLGSPGNKEDYSSGDNGNDFSNNAAGTGKGFNQQNAAGNMNNQGSNNQNSGYQAGNNAFPQPPQNPQPGAAPMGNQFGNQGNKPGQQPSAPSQNQPGQGGAPSNPFNPNMGSEDDIPF